ncbi:MAG: hypothetical protein A2X49_05760 [Lentisphaerae bacterium GWF2_52_8]|nr:MAG: hypothetical protein A2X49_05760 [Lentisphaerae bacterium GWF2_52_8]
MGGKNLRILFLGEPKSANTQSWITGLRNAGCELMLASARSDGSDEAVPIGNPYLPPRLRLLFGVHSVKKIISSFRPDILIAYRVTSYGYLAAQSGFQPLVMAAQNEKIVSDFSPKILRPLLSHFASKAISRATLLHAWSENVASGLLHFGARPEQILTMHRGIDTETFSPPVHERDFSPDKIRIISTRSLYPQYKLDKLLYSFAVLKKDFEKASLTIAGDGPLLEDLRNLASSLGLKESVSFTGKLPPAKISELLKQSTAYVSLIETEGLSSSLLEACSCGVLPAVADIQASRELVQDQKNGIILKSDDPQRLASALGAALRNRSFMADASAYNTRLIREKYDRSRNIEIFLENYRKLL